MRCGLGVWFSLTAREILDQLPSIPDLTLLEVELLAFYRVSQNLHLLTRSEARKIHTSRTHSLRQGQNHGKKRELKHTALKSKPASVKSAGQ